jgi:hypothetical protein
MPHPRQRAMASESLLRSSTVMPCASPPSTWMAGSLGKPTPAPIVWEWGHGSSVVLGSSMMYVAGDNAGSKFGRLRATSFHTALRRDTGEMVWRITRPEERSCGVPARATFGGRRQLVMAGPRGLFGHNLGRGDRIGFSKWEAQRSAPEVHRCSLSSCSLSDETGMLPFGSALFCT